VVIAALSRLVDKSLVTVDEGDGSGPDEARYRLLDTVREYAAARLDDDGETAALRDRHLDHFLALAERAEPELERDQDRWRARLEAERGNLRAALEWGLAATPDPDGVEHGLHTFTVDSLEALAGLAARHESFAEAVRLLAASDAARERMGGARPPIDQPAHDAVVAAATPALGPGGFDEVWAEGTALSLDDAVAYARRARGSRNRPSTGWASLTPTELDVVRLVAEGLTNPEIGERLFVSRATVKTHLSHVYAKLGVANRTELATQAAAHLHRHGT
jgi:DNA-binding CsgD family transcriptional regulator